MKALIQKYIREYRIAGATMIVRKGGVVVCDAHYGYADIERRVPLDNHTILRLASMTKPVVAIAVMMLAERRRLSIDDLLESISPPLSA